MVNRTLRGVAIAGTGSYLPARVLSNADLERMGLDTNDEWIYQRTGIRERRVAAPTEAASDLAIQAARRAIEAAELDPATLDLVVCATMTPDMAIPATAALVARGVGATRAGAFDLEAACSGFVYGLSAVGSMIAAGRIDRALLIGTEVMTRVMDYTDRGTSIIFGDGAGAAILQPSDGTSDILYTCLRARGEETISVPGCGSRMPPSREVIERKDHLVKMNGRETYKFAVTVFRELIEDALAKNGLTARDIALVIPHQVNLRIIESAVQKCGFPMDRVIVNIERYGNTSAASVGIALDEAVRAGRLRRGDLILMVAFGAGLTWGSALVRW